MVSLSRITSSRFIFCITFAAASSPTLSNRMAACSSRLRPVFTLPLLLLLTVSSLIAVDPLFQYFGHTFSFVFRQHLQVFHLSFQARTLRWQFPILIEGWPWQPRQTRFSRHHVIFDSLGLSGALYCGKLRRFTTAIALCQWTQTEQQRE